MKNSSLTVKLGFVAAAFAIGGIANATTTTVNTSGGFVASGQSYTNGSNDTLIFNVPYIFLNGTFTNQGKAINNYYPLVINRNFDNTGIFDVKQGVSFQGGSQYSINNSPSGIINVTGLVERDSQRSFTNQGSISFLPPVGGEQRPAALFW